jgi:hypothetical protein
VLHGPHYVGEVVRIGSAIQDPAKNRSRRIVRDRLGPAAPKPGLDPRRHIVYPLVLIDQQTPAWKTP